LTADEVNAHNTDQQSPFNDVETPRWGALQLLVDRLAGGRAGLRAHGVIPADLVERASAHPATYRLNTVTSRSG
jgi:hypothetical protein